MLTAARRVGASMAGSSRLSKIFHTIFLELKLDFLCQNALSDLRTALRKGLPKGDVAAYQFPDGVRDVCREGLSNISMISLSETHHVRSS